ncbi:CHRD domain-containing protein [Oceanobacillus bengalensis]|uniref:CHRD domain-containing protein n=1 Tax=Oceanobacillus bengalensis TaxID=1435466 RepID=A0A494YSZ8_9BACI|nr:CHRD domain-containing protein [Oceanobacillus bengalensis]RKQ13137.1 CHRD domain-containing protein [Oceanobacillus bengalensis]
MYEDQFFMAELAGSQEAPPVHTDADGTALFHINKREKNIRFRLDVTVHAMKEANIELGSRRISGPTVVKLLEINSDEYNDGLEGLIREADFVGPLKGKSITDFVDLMMSGKTYVNVHTKMYPNGEIRGQIRY